MSGGYLFFAVIPLLSDILTDPSFGYKTRRENLTEFSRNVIFLDKELQKELAGDYHKRDSDNTHKEFARYYNYPLDKENIVRSLRSFTNERLLSVKRELETLEGLENLKNFGYETPKKFNQDETALPEFVSEPKQLNLMHNETKPLHTQRLKTQMQLRTNSQILDPNWNDTRDTYGNTEPELTAERKPPETAEVIRKRSRDFPFRRREEEEQSVCNLDEIHFNVTFQENIDTSAGTFLLVCSGSVIVNKCEGACVSKVRPSVNSYDGFERECACCKDSAARTRAITLSKCTMNSNEVHGYSLSRHIIEPTACECQQCRN